MPKILNKSTDKIPVDAIYVGRPSKWGNPFIIGSDGTREEVVDKYYKWLIPQKNLLACLPELAGKDLVCWCSPKPCHADILLKLSNQGSDHETN